MVFWLNAGAKDGDCWLRSGQIFIFGAAQDPIQLLFADLCEVKVDSSR
jgi:hypothetical protein